MSSVTSVEWIDYEDACEKIDACENNEIYDFGNFQLAVSKAVGGKELIVVNAFGRSAVVASVLA